MNKTYHEEHAQVATQPGPKPMDRCLDCGMRWTATASWPIGRCSRCNPQPKKSRGRLSTPAPLRHLPFAEEGSAPI
jgi:hypothetical protein